MNTLFERNLDNYKDEHYTPPMIVKPLGFFDLDPCSPINRPFDIAKVHYTIEDNGLLKDWGNLRAFVNPPYSNIEEWAKKTAFHGNATMLVFARTETEWFFRYVWNKADSIMFIAKRICFLDANGKKQGNEGAPSVLIAYGKNNVDALEKSGIPGKHLHLT